MNAKLITKRNRLFEAHLLLLALPQLAIFAAITSFAATASVTTIVIKCA